MAWKIFENRRRCRGRKAAAQVWSSCACQHVDMQPITHHKSTEMQKVPISRATSECTSRYTIPTVFAGRNHPVAIVDLTMTTIIGGLSKSVSSQGSSGVCCKISYVKRPKNANDRTRARLRLSADRRAAKNQGCEASARPGHRSKPAVFINSPVTNESRRSAQETKALFTLEVGMACQYHMFQ